MLSSLLSILACTALATAAFGLGRPSLRLLHLDADDPLAVGVYSLVMGLIAAGGILLRSQWPVGCVCRSLLS